MLKDKESKQSIQVTIRVRPLSEKQRNEDPRICVHLEQSHSLCVTNCGEAKKFTFDSISYQQSQEQIFETVGRQCTKDCLEGYNCTIFAYGQTGAGKTYTMMGVSLDNDQYDRHRGLIPRTVKYLFECIDQERAQGVNFIIRCSFLEIYNEQIIDLLNKNNTNLQLREDTRKGVYVQGITEEVVGRSDDIMQLLHRGSKSRHVGSTFYNQTSSRSHSVFAMSIESKYTKNGVVNTKSRQFNFVDLAGSQRTKMITGERLKQGCNINKSLMNLASVINSLSEISGGKMQHVNYRNSKLTFLLKDSLGGNSKTNLIANISPASIFCQQTLSTLSFARRVKLIKREKASINEDSSGNLQSMKNQIKRLKQEVISLMSRLQSDDKVNINGYSTATPQMTSIMHQYVAEQIDKQTRLQMEILKLKDRISHLQDGIKYYSNNQTHLRLIISVLEDKISRLKIIEARISQGLEETVSDQQKLNNIKEYFDSQREQLVRQLESFRGQSNGTRIVKQLLKQAKIFKEDGEQDESLRELLTKNTNFLSMIHSKLEEIAPQKQEIQFNSEFEKKVSLIEIDFHKKEEELLERMEVVNLELNQARNRQEQSEKMLEQAISGQILLEEKIKTITVEREESLTLLKIEQSKRRVLDEQMNQVKIQSEEALSELRSSLLDRENENSVLKKEAEGLKNKVEKLMVNEKYLKQEFDSLQEEKYKIEKVLSQNIQEIKEQKNSLMKAESQIVRLKNVIEATLKETHEIKSNNQKLTLELSEEKKMNKIKLEDYEKEYSQQLINKTLESQELMKQINDLKNQLKNSELRLNEETQELEQLAKQFSDMEKSLKEDLKARDQDLKQMKALINQKEENGSSIELTLNQLKAQLINLRSQKQSNEKQLKKIVEQMKEKIQKDQQTIKSLDIRVQEKVKENDELTQESSRKDKQITELKQKVSKKESGLAEMTNLIGELNNKIDQYKEQIEVLKQNEKQQSMLAMQNQNQLVMIKKSADIELNALKSQLNLKEQHIEQTQKQFSKSKLKLQQNLQQLQSQLEKSQGMFEEREASMKKSLDNQLAAKQMKIMELKALVSEKESQIKHNQVALTAQIQKNKQLTSLKNDQEKMINDLSSQVKQCTEKIQQLKQDLEEEKVKHEKETVENDIIHNQQLDQQTERIDTLQEQNQALAEEITSLKTHLSVNQNSLLKQRKEKAMLEVSVKTLTAQNQDITVQLTELKSKQSHSQSELTQLRQKITKIKQESSNLLDELNAVQRQLVESSEAIAILKEEQKMVKTELAFKNNQIKEAKQEIALLKSQFTKLQKKLSEIAEQDIEKKETITELQKQLSETSQMFSKQIETLEKERTSSDDEKTEKILQIEKQLHSLKKQLKNTQQSQKQLKQKLNDATKSAKDLNKSHQNQKLEITRLLAFKKSLEDENSELQNQKSILQRDLNTLAERCDQLRVELEEVNQEKDGYLFNIEELKNDIIEKDFTQQNLNQKINQLESLIQEIKNRTEEISIQMTDIKSERASLTNQATVLQKSVQQLEIERNSLKEKISKFEAVHAKMSVEHEQFAQYKQKWELQSSEIESLRNTIAEDLNSKERLYDEVCRERENSSNLKMIIENSQAQIRQLEVELEQKDNIYKKLLEKIARNQGESKKTTNSEHYLKTIQLLEKSRSQQLDLRRQNDDLRKVNGNMKEALQEKQNRIREVEKKSQAYGVSMHKRMEQIQKDYFQLEKKQDILVKQRKNLEKYAHQNDVLKEEIKNMKANASKMIQRQEQLEVRFKKSSLDYIQLEKEFEQLKKGQIIMNTHDDKTNYINRLKAQVAALKTEKVLLTDSLNREREEKTKLKAQMRFGKDGAGDMGGKLQLEKKINENKNLQELIFEIVSHLKICVNEPRTKLETIRSVILGTIKEKSAQVKALRQRVRQLQESHEPKNLAHRQAALKQYKVGNYSQSHSKVSQQSKYEKEKDPSVLDNYSRQKMKEFENYYAKLKQSEKSGKFK